MIRLNLEIADPTRSDGPKLLALAALFTQLAQGSNAEQTRAALDEKVAGRVVGMPQAMSAPFGAQAGARLQLAADTASTTGTLDPADNPAMGMPTPAEAFGGHGSAELDADAEKLEALAGAGAAGPTGADLNLPPPAAAFGGAGNVPAPGAGNQAISSQQTGSLPPAPSSVPSAAGAPAAAPAGVELDVEGIPWDASIHASTKAKLASGAWKVKRGTPELYLKERKELLRQAVAAGGNAAPAGVPATPPANASVPPPAGAGAPVPPPPSNPGNAPAPIPTPQASGQTTPATAGSNGAVTMAQVLPRVTAAISAGLLTPDSAAAIVRELSDGKIDNVAMLAVAPQLLAPFAARLDVLGIPQ